MLKFHQIFLASSAVLLGSSLLNSAIAAQPVSLKFQSVSALKSFNQDNLKEMNKVTDFSQVTHVRMQETYAGYPVWGGEVIFHTANAGNASVGELMKNSKTTVSGILYQQLDKDLKTAPAFVFTAEQAKKALNNAIQSYQQKTGNKNAATQTKSDLMVYIDKHNVAHWAYLVSFMVEVQQSVPALPTFIMDAATFNVYAQWNNIQTAEAVNTYGGGFGGNVKTGKLIYDGMSGHLPKLDIQRSWIFSTCSMKNSDVTVKDLRKDILFAAKYSCRSVDVDHDSVYWNGEADAINGAYSPLNDALFSGRIIQDMYQKWYGIPALKNPQGKPLMLTMNTHIPNFQNAFFSPATMQMYFGDGADVLYPLVSLGVGAHEISHGFTEQHAKLVYDGQSGGLNESYSDMAAQAAEFYAYGKNTWQIGAEIFKAENEALRYMDEPTKDCKGNTPGNSCSISHVNDYSDGLDVHYSSGIFNKAFYLLGTTKGWDTKKAFDVMVKSNMGYWRSTTDFQTAASCVVKSAQDLNFDTNAVINAFAQVGIINISADECH